MTVPDNFSILEIFSSIQGEGTFVGTAVTFIRLAGCNLNCSWCDTKDTMKQQPSDMSVDEMLDMMSTIGCKHVVFTGGEPLLHREQIMKVINRSGFEFSFHIETNGILDVSSSDIDKFHAVVSPKLYSSFSRDSVPDIDDLFTSRINPIGIVNKWLVSPDVEFKFVIANDKDIESFIRTLTNCNDQINDVPIIVQVGIDDNDDDILRKTARLIDELWSTMKKWTNIRIGIQLHKLLRVR